MLAALGLWLAAQPSDWDQEFERLASILGASVEGRLRESPDDERLILFHHLIEDRAALDEFALENPTPASLGYAIRQTRGQEPERVRELSERWIEIEPDNALPRFLAFLSEFLDGWDPGWVRRRPEDWRADLEALLELQRFEDPSWSVDEAAWTMIEDLLPEPADRSILASELLTAPPQWFSGGIKWAQTSAALAELALADASPEEAESWCALTETIFNRVQSHTVACSLIRYVTQGIVDETRIQIVTARQDWTALSNLIASGERRELIRRALHERTEADYGPFMDLFQRLLDGALTADEFRRQFRELIQSGVQELVPDFVWLGRIQDDVQARARELDRSALHDYTRQSLEAHEAFVEAARDGRMAEAREGANDPYGEIHRLSRWIWVHDREGLPEDPVAAAWVSIMRERWHPSSGPPIPAQEEVGAWIQQLGADDPATRERATAELTRIGAGVEPTLQRATEHPDDEIAQRATHILEVIRIRRTMPSCRSEADLRQVLDRLQQPFTTGEFLLLGRLAQGGNEEAIRILLERDALPYPPDEWVRYCRALREAVGEDLGLDADAYRARLRDR